MNKPAVLKPALIGAGAAALASSIPLVNFVNACCCAWLLGGGVLAMYLYTEDAAKLGHQVTAGDGAKTGLVTGVLFGVIGSVLGTLVALTGIGQPSPEEIAQVEDALAEAGAPPAVEELIVSMMTAGEAPFSVLFISLGFNIFLGLIFCTLGGIIGYASFKDRAPGSVDVDVPPPSI